MIAFFTALKEEREAVRRGWGIRQAGCIQGVEVESGAGIVHLCSGMGAERIQRAVQLAQKVFQPRVYVLAGFSVGLDSMLEVGDLVWDNRSTLSLPEGCSIRAGRVATCGILTTASQKKAFAEKFPDSPVADLETEAFLAAVPPEAEKLVLRVVSDRVDSDLPLNFAELTTDKGFPDVRAIGLRVATRPLLLPKLLKLGREASLAVSSLADGLSEFRPRLESRQRSGRP